MEKTDAQGSGGNLGVPEARPLPLPLPPRPSGHTTPRSSARQPSAQNRRQVSKHRWVGFSFLTWAFQTFHMWRRVKAGSNPHTVLIFTCLPAGLVCSEHFGKFKSETTSGFDTRNAHPGSIFKINKRICSTEQKKSSVCMTSSLNAMQIPALQMQKVPPVLCFWPGIDHVLPLAMRRMAELSLSHIQCFPNPSAPCYTAGLFHLNVS